MSRPEAKLPRKITGPILFILAALLLTATAERTERLDPVAERTAYDTVETIVLEPVGNEMKFATEEITAKAGTRLKVVMNNTASDAAMYHNFSLLDMEVGDEAGIEEIAMAALEAGETFIPDHEALIASTPMAAPGERTEVEFTVPEPGDYPYICLFPGHYLSMRGVLHATP